MNRLSTLVTLMLVGSIYTHAQATKSTTEAATFRVGLKSIAISAPSTDLDETGPDYRVIFDTFTPNANRLVAAFLIPEELKAITTGAASLSRYALVEVPRGAEFVTITPDIFKQIAGSIAKEFGGSLDATVKDQQDELNRRIKALGATSATVTLDKPVMLGSLFSKSDAFGFGGIIPGDVNGRKTKMVMGTSVIRAQDRVLLLYLYTSYVDEGSVNWVRNTSEKWAEAILAANN